MSRAYRFSDFEAFLRKHSEASPSRQSGHADRLQLDRDSRESPPIERQGRNRNNWGFRTMPISVPGMPITRSGMMAIMIPG